MHSPKAIACATSSTAAEGGASSFSHPHAARTQQLYLVVTRAFEGHPYFQDFGQVTGKPGRINASNFRSQEQHQIVAVAAGARGVPQVEDGHCNGNQ